MCNTHDNSSTKEGEGNGAIVENICFLPESSLYKFEVDLNKIYFKIQ